MSSEAPIPTAIDATAVIEKPETNVENPVLSATTTAGVVDGAESNDQKEDMELDAHAPNDSDDDDEIDEDEEDEDEELPEDADADVLATEGKAALQEGSFGIAVKKYCHALEAKLKALNNEEFSAEAAPFYLNYGDALLTKEENSHDLFNWDKSNEGSSSAPKTVAEAVTAEAAAAATAAAIEAATAFAESGEPEAKDEKEIVMSAAASSSASCSSSSAAQGAPEAAKEEDEEADDMQLAWEILEAARIAYGKRLDKLEAEGKMTEAEVMDASFVHVRLADFLLIQERAEEAAQEYQKAIDLRKKHKLDYTKLQAPYLNLGQALNFCDKFPEALEALRTSEKYIKDMLAGVEGASVDPAKKADYELTLQEIADSIALIENQMKNGPSSSGLSSTEQAKKDAKEAVEGASGFDAPQLSSSSTVDIGVVSSSSAAPVEAEDAEGPRKKRRVDLTKK